MGGGDFLITFSATWRDVFYVSVVLLVLSLLLEERKVGGPNKLFTRICDEEERANLF